MDELNSEIIETDFEMEEQPHLIKEKHYYLWRVITGCLMYLASAVSFFVGAVNLVDFLTQIASLKQQMGGTLEGITFTLIVSSMTTTIIPMFMFGFTLLGIGTILLISSKREQKATL